MWLKPLILYYMFIVKIVMTGEVGDRCVPNDTTNNGVCLLVTDCEVAVRLIKEMRHHPFSRCGFSELTEVVCCPRDPYNPPQTRTTHKIVTTTPSTNGMKTFKYGEGNSTTRVADRECKKIIEKSIPPLGLHIIGGESVSPGEFPHMVALGYERGDEYQFLCGGSLLSDSYILTAAHCVDTLEQIKPSIARMGVIDIVGNQFNPETDGRIADLILHPSYLRQTKYNDLALLKLEQPAQFSMNLSPACLYTLNEDPQVPLTVTGWGQTSITMNTKSTTLLKANVMLVGNSKCGESYTNWRKLPVGIAPDQICAGDPQGLRDTCQGDSGGPLQGLTGNDGRYRLVGVTSFGRGCGSPVPGVYTRVSHYLDWIESIVWPN